MGFIDPASPIWEKFRSIGVEGCIAIHCTIGHFRCKAFMKTDPVLLEIIAQIYSAVVDPAMWEVALKRLTQAFKCEHSVLVSRPLVDGAAPFESAFGLSDADQKRLLNPFAMGLWQSLDTQMASGRPVSQQEFISDDQYEQSEFYNEIARPVGTFHALHVKYASGDAPFQLAMCRAKAAGSIDAKELHAMAFILPHLASAFGIHRQLHLQKSEGQDVIALMNRLDHGAIIVDESANVIFINHDGHSLLKLRDGLELEGAVLCARGGAGETLKRGIEAACANYSAPTRRLIVPRRHHPSPLLISIMPLSPPISRSLGKLGGRTAVFIKELGKRKMADLSVLVSALGLSVRESEIASLLATGSSTAEIGEQLGLRVSTVRYYLKQIYQKVGENNQASLATLINELSWY